MNLSLPLGQNLNDALGGVTVPQRGDAWLTPIALEGPMASGRNCRSDKDLRPDATRLSAPVAARSAEPQSPPNLAQLVAAWQHLPPAIRAGIVAIVQAAK